MDVVLELLDEYILDDVYARLLPSPPLAAPIKSTWRSLISSLRVPFLPISRVPFDSTTHTPLSSLAAATSAWPRDHIGRQIISLSVVTLLGIHVLYFFFAGLSYRFIFNHDMMRHPRFLPNQVRYRFDSQART